MSEPNRFKYFCSICDSEIFLNHELEDDETWDLICKTCYEKQEKERELREDIEDMEEFKLYNGELKP